MMGIQVGIIGAGIMGSEHARLFREVIKGAELVAVADQDLGAASKAVGKGRTYRSGEELIASNDVDAVLIASPDQTHFDLISACLEAGKPVLCEKPLAVNSEECIRLVAQEAALGRRLIDVGFMRRFDPAYRDLKDQLNRGAIGLPRLVHNQHRNARAPAWFTSAMSLTNAAVHEIDICRWLLETDYTTARITLAAAMDEEAAGDPLLITFETERGTIVSTEVFMNAAYGYHVQCEIAGSKGNALMAHPGLTHLRSDGAERGGFPENWIPRFAEAYRLQNQAWIEAILTGVHHNLASAWDGFAATFIAEKLIAAAESGVPVTLTLPEQPYPPIKTEW